MLSKSLPQNSKTTSFKSGQSNQHNNHYSFSLAKTTPSQLTDLTAQKNTLALISSPFLHPYDATITQQQIIIKEKAIDCHVTLDAFVKNISVFRLSGKAYLKIAKDIVESAYAYHKNKCIHNCICLQKFYIKNLRISLRFPHMTTLDRIDKSRRKLLIKQSVYIPPEVREGKRNGKGYDEQVAEVWAVGMVILQVVLGTNLQKALDLIDNPQKISELVNQVEETQIRKVLSHMLQFQPARRKSLSMILAQLNQSTSNPEEVLNIGTGYLGQNAVATDFKAKYLEQQLHSTDTIVQQPTVVHVNQDQMNTNSMISESSLKIEVEKSISLLDLQKKSVLKLDLFPTPQAFFHSQHQKIFSENKQILVLYRQDLYLLIDYVNSQDMLLIIHFPCNHRYSISYQITQSILQQTMPNTLPSLLDLFKAFQDDPYFTLSPDGQLHIYFDQSTISRFQISLQRELVNSFRKKFLVDISYKSGKKIVTNKGFYLSKEIIISTASAVLSTSPKRLRKLLNHHSAKLSYPEEYLECNNEDEDKYNYSIINAEAQEASDPNVILIINFHKIEGRKQHVLVCYRLGTELFNKDRIRFSCQDSFAYFYVQRLGEQQPEGQPLLAIYQKKVLVVGMYLRQGKGIIFNYHHQRAIHNWILSKHQSLNLATVQMSFIFTPLEYYLETNQPISFCLLKQPSRQHLYKLMLKIRIQQSQQKDNMGVLPSLYLRQARFLQPQQQFRNYQKSELIVENLRPPQDAFSLVIRYLRVRSFLNSNVPSQLLPYLQQIIPKQQSLQRNTIFLLFLYHYYSKLQSQLKNNNREIEYINKQIALLKQMKIYKLIALKLEDISQKYKRHGDQRQHISSLKEAIKYHQLIGNRARAAQVILTLVQGNPTINTIELINIFTLFFNIDFTSSDESKQLRQRLQLQWKKLYVGIINQSQNIEQVLGLLEIATKDTGISQEITNIIRRKFYNMPVIDFN